MGSFCIFGCGGAFGPVRRCKFKVASATLVIVFAYFCDKRQSPVQLSLRERWNPAMVATLARSDLHHSKTVVKTHDECREDT